VRWGLERYGRRGKEWGVAVGSGKERQVR